MFVIVVFKLFSFSGLGVVCRMDQFSVRNLRDTIREVRLFYTICYNVQLSRSKYKNNEDLMLHIF